MKRKLGMIISLSLVAFLVAAVLVYYFGAFYPKFNKLDAKNEFSIPGLDEDFVPQGIEYVESNNLFLVSGYMSDGGPSRIYVVNPTSGEKRFVTIKVTGEDYLGHAGGVATNGNFVWVVGDKKVVTVSLSDILSKTQVDALAETITGNGCDWVTRLGEQLVVGEFYHKGEYETPAIHHLDETNAVAYAYNIDDSVAAGISTAPSYAVALPDNAQGMTVANDKMIISASWSIPSSRLMVYANPLEGTAARTISLSCGEVPLYVLGSGNLVKTIKAPSMSEELVTVNGRVYILFESACKKYRIVNRTRTKTVISIGVENL